MSDSANSFQPEHHSSSNFQLKQVASQSPLQKALEQFPELERRQQQYSIIDDRFQNYQANQNSSSQNFGPDVSGLNIAGLKTPFQNAKHKAQLFFHPIQNPSAFRYLELYYKVYYLACRPKSVFDEILNSFGISDDSEFEMHLNVLTSAARQTYHNTNDKESEQLWKTGIVSVPVCENFCYAFTDDKYKMCSYEGNPDNITQTTTSSDATDFKCPKCSSTKTVHLEYVSPRLIASHMLGFAPMARLLKYSPYVDRDVIDNVFKSDVVNKLRLMGKMTTSQELLFSLMIDDCNTYVVNDVELIQVSLVLLNLPPSEREKRENQFPVFYLPRESKLGQRTISRSFLKVIVDDFKELSSIGFNCFDADVQQISTFKCYLGFVTGDLVSQSLEMGYSTFLGSNCPCFLCTAKRQSVELDPNNFCTGIPNFETITTPDNNTPLFRLIRQGIKDKEWYVRYREDLDKNYDFEKLQFHNSIIKESGIVDINPFLELDTIFLPDSFPFDIQSVALNGVLRTLLNVLLGGPSCYDFQASGSETQSNKYSCSPEAFERLKVVLEGINITKVRNGNFFTDHHPFNIPAIINGEPHAFFDFDQLQEFFSLFEIIFFETYKESGAEEDALLAELVFLLKIVMGSEIDASLLDFLESSFTSVLQRFEQIITNKNKNRNLSVLTLQLHLVLHTVYEIRKCGNLQSFSSPSKDKVIKLMKGYNRPQDHYLKAIMNYKMRAFAAQSLLPVHFTFQTGRCKFLVELDKFPEITIYWDSMSIYEQMTMIQTMHTNGISFENMKNLGATARIFSYLNHQVWIYFTQLYNTDPTSPVRLCQVDSDGKVIGYPTENDIFLDPRDIQRYASCTFLFHGQTILHKSIIRLNTSVNGSTLNLIGQCKSKPRYVYAHEFCTVTVNLYDEQTKKVTKVSKDMVLFTDIEEENKATTRSPSISTDDSSLELETNLAVNPKSRSHLRKKLMKANGIQVADAFGTFPNNTKPGKDSSQEQYVNYGYYYTVEFTEQEASKLWSVIANSALSAINFKHSSATPSLNTGGSGSNSTGSVTPKTDEQRSSGEIRLQGSDQKKEFYSTLGYFAGGQNNQSPREGSIGSQGSLGGNSSKSGSLPLDQVYSTGSGTTHSSDTTFNASIFNFPPAKGPWGIAPIEEVSNPVLSVPIIASDGCSVNVHLHDPRFEGSLIIQNDELEGEQLLELHINCEAPEYQKNVPYKNAASDMYSMSHGSS